MNTPLPDRLKAHLITEIVLKKKLIGELTADIALAEIDAETLGSPSKIAALMEADALWTERSGINKQIAKLMERRKAIHARLADLGESKLLATVIRKEMTTKDKNGGLRPSLFRVVKHGDGQANQTEIHSAQRHEGITPHEVPL